MKIALVAKKGGVGKTTLCLLLYEAFKRAERTVAVRDYDAQGSASKALDAFGGQKENPGQTYDAAPKRALASSELLLKCTVGQPFLNLAPRKPLKTPHSWAPLTHG